MNWNLIFLTVTLLVPLVWLIRQVHEGLQELFYLLTGDKTIAVYLFQILLLPGVVLHEFSHYLAARLLRVRVRSISLSPRVQSGKIQMGAVAMDRPDFIRSMIIGMAPLVLGSTVIVLIGNSVFEVSAVIQATDANGMKGMFEAIRAAFGVNDAWIWLYAIFAISNAMLPSESDRESLWPVAIFVALIGAITIFAGLGPTLLSGLAIALEKASGVLVIAFSITLFVDVIFVAIIWLLRAAASYLTGRRLDRSLS